MTDRIPGAPGRCKALVTGEELQRLQAGEEFSITLRRDDQPIKKGTPYSKAAVLPDALAQQLCPDLQDPTPKDAFAALHTQKADAVRRATGSSITLRDATNTPLMGLKLYGHSTENGSVGDSGSVAVEVVGKNILKIKDTSVEQGTLLETGDDYVIAQGRDGSSDKGSNSWGNGWFVYNKTGKFHFQKGVTYTISAYYTFLDDPKRPASISNSAQIPRPLVYSSVREDTSKILWYRPAIGERYRIRSVWTAANDVDTYLYIPLMAARVKIENVMIEIGDTVTDYEPYIGQQTLVVPTPEGLLSNDESYDEIDFSRGVLILRCTKQSETPLPDEVLEAYAKLHTYAPTTVITNDAGANMELTYYTPSTAVQMVHSPGDKGKTFTLDEHGCVTLTKDNPVIACGETTIDGRKWYYRKWADGFAECWVEIDEVHDPKSGRVSYLLLVTPFLMKSFSGSANMPQVYARLVCGGQGDVIFVSNPRDINDCTFELTIILPDSVLNDPSVSYSGNLYIAGYWKTPEVIE